MKVRLFGLAAAVIAVAAFGMAPSFAGDDCCKEGEKKEAAAKKDACCDEGKAAKKDDCSDCDEKTAKKDEKDCGKCDKETAKAKGCDGCGENVAKMPKAMTCDDCAKAEKLPCAKCADAVNNGQVVFLPVKGIKCGNCEGAVAKKLETLPGLAKHAVMHRAGGAAIVVEPGKAIKLSDIEKLLAGTKEFSVNDTAALKGKVTLLLDGVCCDTEKKTACEAITKLVGDKKCMDCTVDAKAKTATVTLALTMDSNVSIKAIKDTLTAAKLTLADIEFHGAAEAPKGKS